MRAWGVGAVALLGMSLFTGPGGVLAPSATVGATGRGDSLYPKYGNGGYDVSHYAIAIAYDPATKKLTGTTTITATATQTLSQFDLDFVLKASAVTVNGVKAGIEQYDVTSPADNYGGELQVTPATQIARGSTMTVKVTYSGTPATRDLKGFDPWVTTTTGALATGEPEAAAWWFPSDDHPRDKATYDISITVPKALKAISNGVLVSTTTSGANTTWHWRESQPMATYLAFAAMGSYSLTTTTSPSGLPVYTAIATKVGAYGAAAKADVVRTPEVIDWESSLFGPYPFDSMGAVVPDGDLGYALENQTKPVYDRVFWSSGSAMYVVVHENAHEWYGDNVSVDQWKEIWLNEGFATYAEWLWSEHAEGVSASQVFLATYNAQPATSSFWKIPIGNPTIPQTFDNAVYDRGGMTLAALRIRLGDTVFFQLLKGWAAERAGGTGTTKQFIALAEQESGQDLTAFFNAWLYSTTRPAPTAANGFPTGPLVAPQSTGSANGSANGSASDSAAVATVLADLHRADAQLRQRTR